MIIRALDPGDVGYALYSWREGHKKAPGADRMPWSYYKDTLGHAFEKLLNDPTSKLLGAYSEDDGTLLGWLISTPGKRVHTLHWVHVKHTLEGQRIRRNGVMMALIEAAELGPRFVYTLRARRDRARLPDGNYTKSLDESLVAALRAKGVTPTFVALKEWLK
jgi:hypothetical protein